MSRGSRRLPRTFTPAFTSGNTLTARMSTAGSANNPPLKMRRPRSMSSLRASAVYWPSLTCSSPVARRRLAGQRALGDAAGDVPRKAVGFDGHLVAERHGDFAGDEERILLHGFGRPHEPFVRGWQHGVREIRGLDARQRHLHLAFDEDLAARDAEVEIGRRVDARFGNVDHAQVLAFDADFAVGQVVAPLDLALSSRACPRRPWRVELNSRLLETMRASISSARNARLSW